MSDIDISRGMVEHLCHIHRGYEQHGTVAMLLALRAALDAAEARERRAVEAERLIWVASIEHYFDATAVMDVERYAAAIRARGRDACAAKMETDAIMLARKAQ